MTPSDDALKEKIWQKIGGMTCEEAVETVKTVFAAEVSEVTAKRSSAAPAWQAPCGDQVAVMEVHVQGDSVTLYTQAIDSLTTVTLDDETKKVVVSIRKIGKIKPRPIERIATLITTIAVAAAVGFAAGMLGGRVG